MTDLMDPTALRAVVTRRDRPDKCVLCGAIGEDVWGIAGVQLQLCQDCRIRWRRGLGYPDFSS